jgi:hypothetical protein
MGGRWTTVLVAAVLAVPGVAACGSSSDDEGVVAAGTPSAARAQIGGRFTVTSREYSFDVPPTLTGGVVTMTLSNAGQKDHEGLFLRVGELAQDQALAAFAAAQNGGPLPDQLGGGGGVGIVAAGRSRDSTFELRPGTYLFICTLTDRDTLVPEGDAGPTPSGPALPTTAPPTAEHFNLGMVAPVTVNGDTGLALPDDEGPTVTARDHTFETSRLSAGRNTVLFRNVGPEQPHHAVVLEFPAGVGETAALRALRAFADARRDGRSPPPGTPQPTPVGDIQLFDPGRGGTFDATLQAGRTYVVACFVSDRAGGPPHAFGQNMVEPLTVR